MRNSLIPEFRQAVTTEFLPVQLFSSNPGSKGTILVSLMVFNVILKNISLVSCRPSSWFKETGQRLWEDSQGI